MTRQTCSLLCGITTVIVTSVSKCLNASTCISEVRVYFTQCEFESLQSSQQGVVSEGHPERALFVTVAVTHTAERPHRTLKTHIQRTQGGLRQLDSSVKNSIHLYECRCDPILIIQY